MTVWIRCSSGGGTAVERGQQRRSGAAGSGSSSPRGTAWTCGVVDDLGVGDLARALDRLAPVDARVGHGYASAATLKRSICTGTMNVLESVFMRMKPCRSSAAGSR